ncbi:hypothetical protein B0T14DRAFT_7488 [Immersiella caudata]|uniref:Uncharacterized protein n=1 Tax=Immersiella caudata TaxID=314043 RepID=A0AA39XCZ9_9PEZI|nr:hypothetical protein B0T14DRAFT_7488 [Immersiella caudata]
MHQRAGCSDAIAFLACDGYVGSRIFLLGNYEVARDRKPPPMSRRAPRPLLRAIARCQHSQLVKIGRWWARCEAWGDAVVCSLAAKRGMRNSTTGGKREDVIGRGKHGVNKSRRRLVSGVGTRLRLGSHASLWLTVQPCSYALSITTRPPEARHPWIGLGSSMASDSSSASQNFPFRIWSWFSSIDLRSMLQLPENSVKPISRLLPWHW